jgi:hypothetical protein
MKQISAIERLQSLPPVFRGADLTVRFQWTSKTASQYLYLWKRRKLVEELGGHSDVFANMLMTRQPNWEQALLLAMPSALLIGVDALRQAGWTTQILQRPAIAVNARQAQFSIARFEVDARGPKWFEAVQPGVVRESRAALPRLAPAWALADLMRSGPWGSFGLWPDDIEWQMVTPADEVQWQQACAALALPALPLLSMAQSGR